MIKITSVRTVSSSKGEETPLLTLMGSHASKEQVIIEYQFTVVLEIDGEQCFFISSDVGEAYAEEKRKGFTLARVAATRATKRALERLLGEEFINRVILSLFPTAKVGENEASSKPSKHSKPSVDTTATDKQKAFIRELQRKGTISKEIDADKLTFRQARKLLDEVLNKKNISQRKKIVK